MSLTYSAAVEQTITAGEQIHQIVNGTATTEVTVEDGSKVPSIRKALLDNFYFKDPIAWQVGHTENVFNQLRQFTDGSWWYAPSATASNPISMGGTPVGDSLWKIYDFDAIGKLNPQIREALRRSYAEAGYDLIGDFSDAGLEVNSVTKVVLWEPSGIAYAYSGTLPHTIGAAETPIGNPSWVSKANEALRSQLGIASVKMFGAKGDGVTDDSAAIQAAVNSGEEFIYFPEGTYFLLTPIQLPATDITLCGTGRASKLKGSAPQLIKFPLSAAGLQFVNDLTFIVSADKVGIQMHKVWDAAGKQEVGVSRCHFYSNSANATFISVKGIWAGRIQDNQFYGNSKANNSYGVLFVTDDNMNSSVMNMGMTGNKFVLVAYPFYYGGRTISAGGRVEGLSFNNNKSIAGKIGLRLAATLASVINGNMFHDNNESAIELNGDFDFVISGNVELTGVQQAILIKSSASSIAERGVINGNKISAGNGKNGIVIREAGTTPRSISITGNMIGRVADGTLTGVGVKIESVTNVNNITVCGNAFQSLGTAVDRGGQFGTMAVNGNSYLFVTNVGAGNQSTPFIKSLVVTLVGGATTETITIAVPVGLTSVRPNFANAVATGTSGGARIIAFYDFDASSATELKFNIARLDGGIITPGGGFRFGIFANMI